MPRYYCDYCDTYLTHDSPSVRKQHNAGYKHKANLRMYYQKFEEQQTQILIDQKIKQHLGQAAMYQQIGAAYNQHLAAFPGQPPRLPIIPPPVLPVPGPAHHQMVPGVRPPVLPLPVPGGPGYGSAPMVAPPGGYATAAPSMPSQPGIQPMNSAPAPAPTLPPPPPPMGVPPSSMSGAPSIMTQAPPYLMNHTGSTVPSANGTSAS